MADLSDLAVQSNSVAQQNNPEFAALNTIIQSRTMPYKGFGDFVVNTLGRQRDRQHQEDLIKLQHKLGNQRTLDDELRRLNDELMRNGYQPANTVLSARQQLGRLYEQNSPQIGAAKLPYSQSPQYINRTTGAGIANPYAKGSTLGDILPYDLRDKLYNNLNTARREAVITGDYTNYNNANDQLESAVQEVLLNPIQKSTNNLHEKLYSGIGSDFIDFIKANTPERIDRTTSIQKAYPFIKPDYNKAKEESYTDRGARAQVQRDVEDQLNRHLEYLNQNGLTSITNNKSIMTDLAMRGILDILNQTIPGATLNDVDIVTKDGINYKILYPSTGTSVDIRRDGDGLAIIGIE